MNESNERETKRSYQITSADHDGVVVTLVATVRGGKIVKTEYETVDGYNVLSFDHDMIQRGD